MDRVALGPRRVVRAGHVQAEYHERAPLGLEQADQRVVPALGEDHEAVDPGLADEAGDPARAVRVVAAAAAVDQGVALLVGDGAEGLEDAAVVGLLPGRDPSAAGSGAGANTQAMLRLGFLRRDRAARLGTKSRSRMAVSMVSRVVRATFCGWFRTSETVWKLTPARRATSLIVVWPIVPSRAGPNGRGPARARGAASFGAAI